jgi:hypothetical protein
MKMKIEILRDKNLWLVKMDDWCIQFLYTEINIRAPKKIIGLVVR